MSVTQYKAGEGSSNFWMCYYILCQDIYIYIILPEVKVWHPLEGHEVTLNFSESLHSFLNRVIP